MKATLLFVIIIGHCLDAVAETALARAYEFDQEQLDELTQQGTIKLPHPLGTGTLDIHLVRRLAQPGGEWIEIKAEGLAGTITRRGDRFVATIATPEGVVTIQNQGGGSRLIEHQRLREQHLYAPDTLVIPLTR